MAAVTPRRARLGARLRTLREERYPSGLQFAAAVGWPQSRVSKLERGAQLPSHVDLERWLQVTEHPPGLLDELLDQLAGARVDYTPDRDVAGRSGFVDRQQSRRVREATTTLIVEYQPSMVPGLVQTASYARELLAGSLGGLAGVESGTAQVEGLVAARMQRQELLYDPAHRLEVIVGEAALHCRPGSAETMRGQLDRLVALADLASVELRVVPFSAPLAVLPLTNFALHDERVAIVESLTGEQEHSADDEVAVYVEAARRLRDIAAVGPDATELVRRAASLLP